MALEDLTPQQQAFIARYLGKGPAASGGDPEIVATYEDYLEAERRFRAEVDKVPASDPTIAGLVQDAASAIGLKDTGDFRTAGQQLDAIGLRLRDAAVVIATRRAEVLQKATATGDAVGATPAEIQAAAVLRQAVVTAMADAYPVPDAFGTAATAQQNLEALIPVHRANALCRKRRQDILDQIDPLTATVATVPPVKKHADAVRDALKDDLPGDGDFTKAQAAIKALRPARPRRRPCAPCRPPSQTRRSARARRSVRWTSNWATWWSMPTPQFRRRAT